MEVVVGVCGEGMEEEGGMGWLEEKLSMAQRRILCSLAARERIRSAWKRTLGLAQYRVEIPQGLGVRDGAGRPVPSNIMRDNTHQSMLSVWISVLVKCG